MKEQRKSRGLESALEYANDLNFSVIQANKNKKAISKWKWFQERRASNEELKAWFERRPDANVAILTGHLSNLTIVDADNAKAFKVISAVLPERFVCPICTTPNGGRHLYFRFENGIRNQTRIFPKCDLRAEGGYVVAPPSRSIKGISYKWTVSPFKNDIPQMPADLRNFLLALQKAGNEYSWGSGTILSEGRRDEDLFHFSNVMAKQGLEKENLKKIIGRLARICSPAFDANEASRKVDSAIERLEGQERQATSLVLVRLSEIAPRPISWLWRNRFPKNALSTLVGESEVSKSMLALDIAARVTTGMPWPDCNEMAPKGSVIILTAEDGLAEVLRNRADAAGCDVGKIIVLKGVQTRGGIVGFSLERHLGMLERALRDNPDVALIIIDPISAYLGAVNDKNAELRSKIYTPLTRLAEEQEVTVLGIGHFGKNVLTKDIHRILDSTAHAAAPRAIWSIEKETKNSDRRVLKPIKMNYCPNPTPLAFTIEDDEEGRPRIVYDENPVHPVCDGQSVEATELEKAKKWLSKSLRGGKKKAKIVLKKAEQEGIPVSTLNRAKRALGIKSRKGISSEKGKWYWELPLKEK